MDGRAAIYFSISFSYPCFYHKFGESLLNSSSYFGYAPRIHIFSYCGNYFQALNNLLNFEKKSEGKACFHASSCYCRQPAFQDASFLESS